MLWTASTPAITRGPYGAQPVRLTSGSAWLISVRSPSFGCALAAAAPTANVPAAVAPVAATPLAAGQGSAPAATARPFVYHH